MKLLYKIQKLNRPTKLSILVGIIIISAGVYYTINDLTTSGVTMGEAGEKYGVGTIDGKGMIFLGIIVTALFVIIFNAKLHND
jgi:hypothetical protein